jgi:undecaprenyl-diphosphatase
MNFFEAIISGIVQGVTEFLPVSSSGHLVILHKIIGLEGPQLTFDIFLHLGTLIAIFMVFWKDILNIFTVNRRGLFFIFIATLSTAVFVIIFQKNIEDMFVGSKLTGVMLMVTGVWIIIGSFVRFGSSGFTGLKSFIIGIAQGISAIPGISRSGATISTALFLGIDPQSAARFSFVLSIPAIIGAFALKIRGGGLSDFNINCIFGLIVSCIVGILSLKLLLKILRGDRLYIFGLYCIIMGIIVVIFL